MLPVSKKYNNQNWLPNFFNDFFDNVWMARTNATAPAINVLENEKSYDIELAAPGMTKDDFKVSLDDNGDLVINMEKKEETKDENNDENNEITLVMIQNQEIQENHEIKVHQIHENLQKNFSMN